MAFKMSVNDPTGTTFEAHFQLKKFMAERTLTQKSGVIAYNMYRGKANYLAGKGHVVQMFVKIADADQVDDAGVTVAVKFSDVWGKNLTQIDTKIRTKKVQSPVGVLDLTQAVDD